MKKSKPIIAIAGEISPAPKESVFKNYERHFCCESFVKVIREANGIGVILPVLKHFSQEEIYDLISSIDGLLLPGGDDIDPSIYNEKRIEECGQSNLEMDLFHLALIKEALEQEKPILGICRGNQLINVACGGTLYQDIKKDTSINHKNLNYIEEGCHNITIKNDTLLYSLLNKEYLTVNTLHHQSINKLGKNLNIAATSEDGIIESIYLSKKNYFCLGVQWHPESMSYKRDDMKELFKGLIKAC